MKKIIYFLLFSSLLGCSTTAHNKKSNVTDADKQEKTANMPDKADGFSVDEQENQNVPDDIKEKEPIVTLDKNIKGKKPKVSYLKIIKDDFKKLSETIASSDGKIVLTDEQRLSLLKTDIRTGFESDRYMDYYGTKTLLLKIPDRYLFNLKSEKEKQYVEQTDLDKNSIDLYDFGVKIRSSIESSVLLDNIDIDNDVNNLNALLNIQGVIKTTEDEIKNIKYKLVQLNNPKKPSTESKKNISSDKNKANQNDSDLPSDSDTTDLPSDSDTADLSVNRAASEDLSNESNDVSDTKKDEVVNKSQNYSDKSSVNNKTLIKDYKAQIKELEDKVKMMKKVLDSQGAYKNRQHKLYVQYSVLSKYMNNTSNLYKDNLREDLKHIVLADIHAKLLSQFSNNIDPNKKYIVILNVAGDTLSSWGDDKIKIERTIYSQFVYNYFEKNFKNVRIVKRYIPSMPTADLFLVLANYEGVIPSSAYNIDKGSTLQWLFDYNKLEQERKNAENKKHNELDAIVSESGRVSSKSLVSDILKSGEGSRKPSVDDHPDEDNDFETMKPDLSTVNQKPKTR